MIQIYFLLNNLLQASGEFEHCDVENIRVNLNFEVYPYEDFRANFMDNLTSMQYKPYTDYHTSYYGKINGKSLLSKSNFQKPAPIIVVDLS